MIGRPSQGCPSQVGNSSMKDCVIKYGIDVGIQVLLPSPKCSRRALVVKNIYLDDRNCGQLLRFPKCIELGEMEIGGWF